MVYRKHHKQPDILWIPIAETHFNMEEKRGSSSQQISKYIENASILLNFPKLKLEEFAKYVQGENMF
jgi:hypothetical protein